MGSYSQMEKLLAKPAKLSIMSVGLFSFDFREGHCFWNLDEQGLTTKEQPDMQHLLDNYSDLFEVPKGLPPLRKHDRRIVLKEGTSLIKIRPYRYPTIQKEEVEIMIEELLVAGVIRDNTSPYSSPIIMVKKKDGSWRMCIDYRYLTGNYRRFIQGYGSTSRPLTDLLKKENFGWSDFAAHSFEQLKKLITYTPILALPYFSKIFLVESDASGKGIGVVLAQEGRPIAFFSKGLSDKNKALFVYERELLALVSAIQK
ncbi:hypothetical protein T459_02181 [Capsicum annuum]|uniref:Reverse transcriptase/retrotransposon-derived protein RNase H-like domain-containing protein n=1 Tax=Capsicum annuum TaxID=4072 RepID=A0A2G3AJA1_CAPAN|nr:hypothetical protein T459_02181 [Capsicum annuum]